MRRRSDEGPLPGAWLVYTDMDGLHAVPLTPPGLVIGRDPGQCDLAVRDFGISRRHARIDVDPHGQMRLTDLKSKGGSQVNRVPVVETPIAVGDRLLLGKVEFAVAASLPPGSRAVETTPPVLREPFARVIETTELGELSPRLVESATREVREPSLVARPPVTLEEALASIDALCARMAASHAKAAVHAEFHDGGMSAAPGVSPEQLRGDPADARSDVFIAACIAYKLVTGHAPFEGETFHAVTYRILHEDPPDPRTRLPSLPAVLAAWLRQGLAKEPAERFADGRQMLDALRRLLQIG